ncbi:MULTISPECIES: long-chain fatty acid--CoA ligase [unclassified Corynebacterium]|uniref:AMP-dependent synthetase/ligase n=1 Tax=unclassified Corynebacterium TaxID=2624378 RepID=UPI0029C9E182|nr:MULTISPECIES: long-chain fatty acid--CoA ligase [unclassified Corynebacterium]WPF65553.1 long-chain fatty acid--CoA ligase [Corynebacterium sp. 22KM0430]WPF68048.1 long-chain fatty acid--CoA ligase [Corynebacterium sp. 21KM1197]
METQELKEYTVPAKYEVKEGETCLTALIDQARSRPYSVLFSRPANYEWVNVTATEFIEQVFEVAKGLIAAGVEKGDRVILLSSTRYEWTLFDYAIWAAGAASVPIYPSSSMSQVEWIVEDSGAVLAITETQSHTEMMNHLVLDEDGNPMLSGSTSRLTRVLEINASAVETLRFEGRDITDEQVWERIKNTKSSDLASLVYTSGTTGRPKGCIHTHYAWLSEVRALLTNPIGAFAAPGRRVLTYLPLAHVLARAVSLAVSIAGATQSHWPDPSTLTVELQRSRPNLLLGVPRVFEKVRNAAASQAAAKGAVGSAIFRRAEKVAIEYSRALDTPEGPTRFLDTQRRLYERLVYSKLKAAIGGEVGYCITGGSPMSHDLLHFFRGVGVPVYEGYGLTETCAAAAVDFEDQKIGTVGKPVGGMAVKISEDGEILFRGSTLFSGYWNNEEATRQAFDEEGWYNTGDLGELDSTGHVRITGRKKDLIVTAGGKNVSPAPMEDLLRSHPLISQAMVVGDGKPFIGVLLTLDEEELSRWKHGRNIPESRSIREVSTDPVLRAEIQDAINTANATVSHAEGIKKFYILDRDLTEEANELTPTMKVKRNVVTERYAEEIDRIYRR